MNAASLLRLAASALRTLAPTVPVTIEQKDGSTTTGRATIVPLTRIGSGAEDFVARQAIRTKHRSFTLYPDGLTFEPKAGMYLTAKNVKWSILSISPLEPDEGGVMVYRGVLSR